MGPARHGWHLLIRSDCGRRHPVPRWPPRPFAAEEEEHSPVDASAITPDILPGVAPTVRGPRAACPGVGADVRLCAARAGVAADVRLCVAPAGVAADVCLRVAADVQFGVACSSVAADIRLGDTALGVQPGVAARVARRVETASAVCRERGRREHCRADSRDSSKRRFGRTSVAAQERREGTHLVCQRPSDLSRAPSEEESHQRLLGARTLRRPR
mmetsp:Transcript_65293/g.151496  ORF Transcript_65293/g.151496 Transcript_65293/m.151496 type:complete len:215 (+) Transcript_65293:556-1200(+)